MVLVRVLGPIDVLHGSDRVHAPASALRRTLLALLALHAGRVLTSDWLLENLWSGEPPESGLRALRFHMSKLRKEIGSSGMIETVAGGYRLAEGVRVDAREVETRLGFARREGDHHRRVESYDEVLALWRGTPFGDAAGCAVLDDESGRLTELRLTIIEEQLQARLDAGAGRELIADLRAATSQHPLREALWAMLIAAQYRAGQQAGALRSYEQLRELLAESLGLEPSTQLQDLQRRVLQQDPSLAGDGSDQQVTEQRQRSRYALPSPATALIDSTDQLGAARQMVVDHRLVTLTGTGGVGKTRLAVEIGWSCLDQFEDGVWMVELASVASADSVVGAVTSTLRVRPQPGMTHMGAIIEWLSGRSLLLILDNCEHVVDSVRDLVTILVARCPTVKILCTSRERLGVVGERIHVVRILDPERDGSALFVDRAAAADSSFELSEDECDLVVQICRRLDGLPLAIELAAARIRSMAPEEILERLDERLTLLRRGRAGGDHHDALRATVEWSYRLLGARERAVLDQLSVFAGTFDAAAVKSVCVVDDASVDLVDVLSDLVDKSMIVAERWSGGTRYHLLETMRQFGDAQLSDAARTDLRDRHLCHFVTVAETADELVHGPRQHVGAAIFERNWDDLRAAHRWAIDSKDLGAAERLIAALHEHAHSKYRLEFVDWIELTVSLDSPTSPVSVMTLALGGYWNDEILNHARSDELTSLGIDRCTDFDEPGSVLCLALKHPPSSDSFGKIESLVAKLDPTRDWLVLAHMADHAHYLHPETRDEHLARLVETAERLQAPTLLAEAAMALGLDSVDRTPPDLVAAVPHFERALGIARECGNVLAEAEALRCLALTAAGLQSTESVALCRETLERLFDIRYWYRIWHFMDSAALSLAVENRIEAASVLVGHLEALPPSTGRESYLTGREWYLGFRTRTLDVVQQHPQARAWMTRGAAMDKHQIVRYALAALEQ